MIEDHVKYDVTPKHKEKYEHEEMESCDLIEDIASAIAGLIAEEYEAIEDYLEFLGTLQECLVEDEHESNILEAIKITKEVISEEMEHAVSFSNVLSKITGLKPMSH